MQISQNTSDGFSEPPVEAIPPTAENDERYRLLFDHSLDGIFITVPDGTVLDANPAACAMLQMSKEEICRAGRDGIVENNPSLTAALKERAETGSIWRELTFIRKDGTKFIAETSSVTIIDSRSKSPRSFVIIRDITDRQRTQDSLQESETKFRTLATLAPAGIYICDSDGKCLYTNPRWCEMAGLTPQESLGDGWIAGIHPQDRAELLSKWKRMVESNGRWGNEYRFQTRDGKITWVYGLAAPQLDTLGKIVGYVGINLDITDRKLAEEKLKESEERYRTLFESMGEGFALCEMIYDASGKPVDYRHIKVNPAYTMLTGLPATSVVGQTVKEMLPQIESSWIETYGRIVETGQPERCEHYSAELKKYYEVYAWKSGHGCFAVVFTDITQRKESQQQAIQYQKELAHASRLSTIGEMASSLAHELNQPFCAILTHAEGAVRMLWSASYDTEKLTEKMDTIAKQAEHAGAIINRIKNFTKKNTSQAENIDINATIHDVVEFVKPETKRLRIKVYLNLAPNLPPVKADSVQIEQVLLNLVKNSIEAMEDVETRRRTLTITTSQTSAGDLDVSVCDHGKGISSENIDKVFDSFFTTKNNGLGIGLSISKSIIKSHGGKIYVTSNLDSGVTFCFNLPLT